uniref:hypothetical protein n=1 Tax=Comamonas testosteroni TaxID=285 RepID=UPI0015FBF52B|nr:hypothetical protein [Comamonas testosteroni]
MEAKILILRELGHLKVPVEIANKASGSITLYHERPSPSDERTVPVLHILDGSSALPAKRRKLFEPRITYMGVAWRGLWHKVAQALAPRLTD